MAKNPTPSDVKINFAVRVSEFILDPTKSFGLRPKTAPPTVSTTPPAKSKNLSIVLFFENCSKPSKPNLLLTSRITKGWSKENLVFFRNPKASLLLLTLA